MKKLAVAALAIAVPTSAVASTPPAGADNAHVYIIGEVEIPPGEPGEVTLIQGQPGRSSLPVVVRNDTADTLHGVDVTGVARDGAGELVASGSAQGFKPAAVEPGEWAMGYVYFGPDDLAGDAVFDLDVSTGESLGPFDPVDLEVVEAVVRDDGDWLRVVGIVENSAQVGVDSPTVFVACFGDDGALIAVEPAFPDALDVPAGATSPFTADLFDTDECPNVAVAADGWPV